MGRRARTNCSPIDSAMEKYHMDIGSRLSGVFVPPQPGLENGSNPTDTLNMFTLDTRSKMLNQDSANNAVVCQNSVRQMESSDRDSRCTRDYSPHYYPVSCQKTETFQTLPASMVQTPSSDLSTSQNTTDSYSSCAEEKDKKGIVDKLTRALFQRKHTCTRCQRKSKSCLPNKNFNTSEKHYMCGRCRETSHAMKTLVSGQSGPANGIPLMNGGTGDVILHKPRIHLKDSGYETVTSCSTVASAHSHSTETGSSTKPQVTNVCVEELSQKNNNGTPRLEEPVVNQQSSAHGSSVQASYRNATGLEQYMGVTRDNSPVRVLKQVKTRYVENYDGYLPNAQNKQDRVVTRPALPAFANSEGVDTTYCDTNCTAHRPPTSSTQKNNLGGWKDTNKCEKMCYTCRNTLKPCFRLPWEGGWLCEDCLDGVF